MTDPTLLTAVRHNCWANVELIDFCAKLSTEQLAWTTPGTYGSIHQTLQHIVGAEHGYLYGLTDELPPGGPLTADRIVPLGELRERAQSNAERIEAALAGERDPDRMVKRPSGAVAAARVIASQFIHHGSDHRAHIGSILGAHGVEPPNLDVWQYGRSTGAVIPPPS
jgi:uncharacterized damage-inducible protein DinB